MPVLKEVASERKVQEKRVVDLDAHSGQLVVTGLLVETLAERVMTKVSSLMEGSVTVRMSWPESRAPVDEPGGP